MAIVIKNGYVNKFSNITKDYEVALNKNQTIDKSTIKITSNE